ncbi:sensor histidine kinase [Actinocorallia sp. A-T 12471]|uniref:sensor histidine kinase n=1 Tax=Actinocorallia sp. A-T 12471 TaxID=3089813 RepID=UPI0029CD990D|nr:histidine kinase [Actinocorallia sp. A-T 12471]MDX6743322.1 histidine kinase [Actinocorallia sp. A-T 12471]
MNPPKPAFRHEVPAGTFWESGRIDLALAGLLAVWALLEVLPDGPDPFVVEAAFALAVTLPVALRRHAPLLLLAVVVAALLARAATATGPPATVAPFPSILVGVFSAALHARSGLGAVVGCALALGGMLGAEALRFYGARSDFSSLAVMVFFIVGAWGAGLLLRRRDAAARAADVRARERAREAVAAERLRIARELHDVVAHSLSVIAVNAGAAREVGGIDPELARGHMDAVAVTAREALAEMRLVLEALRADGDESLAPQPTLDLLPDLIDRARADGLPVRLTTEGVRQDLSAGLELAVYRIVQEALTNVRKHAGHPETEVRLTYGPAEVTVRVHNAKGDATTPSDEPGYGLPGMRERTRLYGGTLNTGPTPDGGYLVLARLPLEAP